jgi:hypothetical protein
LRLSERGLVGPGHQFGDAVDRVAVGDPDEGVGEISFRVYAIQFGGLQDRVHGGSALAAGITAGEEPIASAEDDAADGVFGDVVVGFEPGVGGGAGERGAPLDYVAQCLGQFRSRRELPLCRAAALCASRSAGGAKRALSSMM